MIRRLAAISLTTLLTAAGLGCGGDAAEGPSGASAEAIAKVDAADYARAVNLQAADVPYFEVIPTDEDDDPEAERRREAEWQSCIGADHSEDPLAEVSSPTYGVETPGALLQVESTIAVSEDEAGGAREADLIGSPRAERCFRRAFIELMEEEETASVEMGHASLSRLRFPAAEIEDAFAYRFRATVTAHRGTTAPVAYRPAATEPQSQTLDVYIDLLGFVSGRAAVILLASGAPTPVDKNLERNLLRLLYRRAHEHSP